MTVRGKLSFLVVSAILGLLLASGLALYQLQQVYTAANYGNENTVPSLQALTHIEQALSGYRVRAWRHLAAETPEAKSEQSSLMAKDVELARRAHQDYQALLSDAEDRQLWEQEGRLLGAYFDMVSEGVRLSEQGKEKEAARHYLKNLAISTELLKVLQDHATYNKKLGNLSTETAKSTLRSARVAFSVLSVVLLLGLTVLGMYIVRSLLSELGGEPSYARQFVKSVAEGDLTQSPRLQAGDTTSLLAAMGQMSSRLAEVMTQVNTSAQHLTAISEQVSASSQSLSQSATEQAANVQETSASVEQITATIAQNSDNAKLTESISTRSASDAEQGGQAVGQTVAAMREIASKIGIVDDIAYQTNLLALNAAIEAARAGQHGKGFAVVAAEVRKLAERSQIAAQEIGQLARSSVSTAENAGALLLQTVPNIRKTADLVQEIASASQEQNAGVSQISQAMEQLSQVTQQNASASEELAASAQEMSGQSAGLQDVISYFRLDSLRGRPQRGGRTSVARGQAHSTAAYSDYPTH